eukprot:579336-Rhodomonas_salina.4
MVFQEILRISRDSGRMMSRAACTIKVGGGVSGPRPFSPAAVDLCDAGIGVCDAGLEGGEADNHRGDAAVRLTSMTPQTRSSHTGSKGPQRDLNCARNCCAVSPFTSPKCGSAVSSSPPQTPVLTYATWRSGGRPGSAQGALGWHALGGRARVYAIRRPRPAQDSLRARWALRRQGIVPVIGTRVCCAGCVANVRWGVTRMRPRSSKRCG